MQNDLTLSNEYLALKATAIANLSNGTDYISQEDNVRELMIDAWISAYYYGRLEGYKNGMGDAINVISKRYSHE